ncbi:MAG: CPBP family glutamic-type intramembrane protease [Terrimicrobiaceae bacterium]
MSPLAKITIYLLAVLLAACLISPVAYWAVQGLEANGFTTGIAGFPFHRFFSRTVQIAVIVLGIPFAWWLGFRHLSDFGLVRNPKMLTDLSLGLALALVVGVGLLTILWAEGYVKPQDNPAVRGLLRIVGTAAMVSLIEEFLFRGVLLGLTVRAVGSLPGSVLVSLIFAAVHFLRPSKSAIERVTWTSGFEQVAAVFHQLPDPVILGYGLLTLFAAGLLLAWVTLRTRSLWLAIGIHTGWIFAQQAGNLFMKPRARPSDAFLPWYGPNLVSGAVPTGLLPLAALLLLTVMIGIYFRYARRGGA